jgi:hypothetical protein
MNRSQHHINIRGAFFSLLLSILAIVPAPLATSQPGPNPFDDQRFLKRPTPTPTVSGLVQEQPAPKKAMPRSLKISITAALFAAFLVMLAFAMRAWRAGNLFDREYRFPAPTSVAMRLGAKRSGGCVVTITFPNHVEAPRESGRKNS